METIISLIRHGDVYNPMRKMYARLPRFHLSDLGQRQAQFAADMLFDNTIAAIYASPMLRTRQTAGIIANRHPGTPVRISKHLIEIFTMYQGWPVSEMEKIQWNLYAKVRPPYERPEDVLRRIQAFMKQARRRHPGQHIVAVTHGDLIAFIILWSQGKPIGPGIKPDPYPSRASITTFTYRTTALDEVPSYEYWEPSPVLTNQRFA
jgi:broad specificity phosphatase PhoE